MPWHKKQIFITLIIIPFTNIPTLKHILYNLRISFIF